MRALKIAAASLVSLALVATQVQAAAPAPVAPTAPAEEKRWTQAMLVEEANKVPGGLRLSVNSKMLPNPVKFTGFNGYGANGLVEYRKRDGNISTSPKTKTHSVKNQSPCSKYRRTVYPSC